jgi:trigger factor
VPQGVGVQVPSSPHNKISPVTNSGIIKRDNNLNIEQQTLENHQVKLTVQLEQSKLEEAKQRAARHISQRKKIPGFRPGKAPYPIVLRTIGEEAILEEALDLLVKDIYPKVIEEAKIKPYGPGSLENMPKLDPPTFEFVVPLEPEVTLSDYKQIRIPYKLKSITKKDINKVLDDLRERQVILEPSKKPAIEGDQVYIKLSIKRTHPAEGELSSLVNERRMPLVITSGKDLIKTEWPFPGFSRQLLGMSNGEEKVFTYTYPQDSDFKELRGKETEVRVLVEEVKNRILPQLTDEFAQSVGDQYENLDALIVDIRKQLEKQAKDDYDANYNDKIMKEILKNTVVKFPPQMLEREIDLYLDQMKNRLAEQKLDMDTYLKMRKMDMKALREETQPLAEERLKRTLILLEISKLENIHVENSELETESMRTLDELGRMMPADKAKKTLTNEFVRGMIGNIGADLLVQHTWEYLQSVARGEKVEPIPENSTEAETKIQTEAKTITETKDEAEANQASVSTTQEKIKKKRITKKVEKNEPK